MSNDLPPRSHSARVAAETALVRIIHHYGAKPEFVVLGGLGPEMLCANSAFQHAETTDVDVQVNLEIAQGSVNAGRHTAHIVRRLAPERMTQASYPADRRLRFHL